MAVGTVVACSIRKVLGEDCVGSSFIGCSRKITGKIGGTGAKHKDLIAQAGRLVRSSPLMKEGFTYSALGYAVGKEGVEDLLREQAVGKRAIWLWSKGAQNWLKFDGSKKFSGQHKLVAWARKANIKLQSDPLDIVGLSFFNGPLGFRDVPGAEEALVKHGFHPSPSEHISEL